MKKDKKSKRILDWIFFIVPIIISIILCTNGLEVFAHLGIEKFQVEYADRCRTNYDITNALEYYGRIGEHDSKYAPYANLACAQMHNEQQQYEQAFVFYKKAIVSDDIRVLSSCMEFVISQINADANKKENAINLLDESNVNFVIDLINKINEILPEVFMDFNVKFPIDESFVNNYLNPDSKITVNKSCWKYDYTLVDTDGSLAYVKDNERLDFVATWDELLNSKSFDTVTKYKYYHYVLEAENKEISILSSIQDSIIEYRTIESKPIKVALEEFENEENMYEKE